MPVMDRVRHATILPFPRSPLGAGQAQCGRNIQKNRCRTTVVSRFGETLAELPFTGNQVVCLGRDQAASSGPGGSIRPTTIAIACPTDVARPEIGIATRRARRIPFHRLLTRDRGPSPWLGQPLKCIRSPRKQYPGPHIHPSDPNLDDRALGFHRGLSGRFRRHL
jgi:hypothetical protein